MMEKIVQFRDEILKLEIATLLFNVGKLHLGFWANHFDLEFEEKLPDGRIVSKKIVEIKEEEVNGKKIKKRVFTEDFENYYKNKYGFAPFKGYAKYYEESKSSGIIPFQEELKRLNLTGLYEFFAETKINFDFLEKEEKELTLLDVMKLNSKRERSKSKFIKELKKLESINSIMHKGLIIDEVGKNGENKKTYSKHHYLCTPFGKKKLKVDFSSLEEKRIKLWKKINIAFEESKKGNDINWPELREKILLILEEVCYKEVPSDSRKEICDVTLWEQVRAFSSLAKAYVVDRIIGKNKNQTDSRFHVFSILGIQYDKLKLAEKGFKLSVIDWYRSKSFALDEEIKKYLESEIPLGNEIYRDETGVYFLVPSSLIGRKSGEFYFLKDEFGLLEGKIREKFKKILKAEIAPAIFLTGSTRGYLSLANLRYRANDNFKKARVIVPDDCGGEDSEKENKYFSLCQICQLRMATHKKYDFWICKECEEKIGGRLKEWEEKTEGKNNENREGAVNTIWIDEIRGKDNRVALVSLKFELKHWTNGDMFFSLLNRDLKNEELTDEEFTYNKYIERIKKFFLLLSFVKVNKDFRDKIINILVDRKSFFKKDKNIEKYNSDFGNFFKKLNDFRGNIKEKDEDNEDNLRKAESSEESNYYINYIRRFKKLKKFIDGAIIFLEEVRFQGVRTNENEQWWSKLNFLFSLLTNFKEMIANGFDKYFPYYNTGDNRSFNDYLRKRFFIYLLGTDREKVLKREGRLSQLIDFENEVIKWENILTLDKSILDEFMVLWGQYLLGKSPAPPRLLSMWKTTREFFQENVRKTLHDLFDEKRKKRLRWKNIFSLEKGLYKDGSHLFYVNEEYIYLLSPLSYLPSNKRDFYLTKVEEKKGKGFSLSKEAGEVIYYSPWLEIISPTPVSYQLIMPSEYVFFFLEKVKAEYQNNFSCVYGKLPLSVGVVIQHYKFPLYIGIKALRKLRRDGIDWSFLKVLKDKDQELKRVKIKEQENIDCKLYRFFEVPHQLVSDKDEKEGDFFRVYLYSDENKIYTLSSNSKKAYFYINTFDFEYLDSNTRINEIYYDYKNRGKRYFGRKKGRPYQWEEWQELYEKFRDIFKTSDDKASEKKNSEFESKFKASERENSAFKSNLRRYIDRIYLRLKSWNNETNEEQDSFKILTTSFLEKLSLKEKKFEDFVIHKLFKVNNFSEIREKGFDDFLAKIYLLLDLFEYFSLINRK